MSKFLEPVYCPCPKVKKLDRLLTRRMDTILGAAGLTAVQFSTLRLLERVGPIVINEFANLMAMDRTTLSRNLKLMIQAGWLTVERHPKDSRQRVAAITPKGTQVHRKAKKLWETEQRFLLKTLGQKRLLELNAMVEEASAMIETVRRK